MRSANEKFQLFSFDGDRGQRFPTKTNPKTLNVVFNSVALCAAVSHILIIIPLTPVVRFTSFVHKVPGQKCAKCLFAQATNRCAAGFRQHNRSASSLTGAGEVWR